MRHFEQFSNTVIMALTFATICKSNSLKSDLGGLTSIDFLMDK